MRLLNKNTFEVVSFFNDDAPPYIILSHRWNGDETSMQQLAAQRDLPSSQWSPGTAKALRLCAEAQAYPEEYVWIDTCCIDKSSSAELQEAINSMYKWYENAELCIVYISDIDITSEDSGETKWDKLKNSNWFTRGWTLQELLAPRKQVFVDQSWNLIGTREQLSEVIADITGILPIYYGDATRIHTAATVAERMSWISNRKTSRPEDMAYCLLGIFNVNMTMLYGEGTKAFLRLEKEIIQSIDDESIFLWAMPSSSPDEGDSHATNMPVLAPFPSCFTVCRGRTIEKSTYFHRDPPRWTTKGLEVELYGERYAPFTGRSLCVILNCKIDGRRACYDIMRSERKDDFGGNVWMRARTEEIATLAEGAYASVPTGQEQYRLRIHELTAKSLALPHVQMQNKGMMSVVNWEREKICFKVFVE